MFRRLNNLHTKKVRKYSKYSEKQQKIFVKLDNNHIDNDIINICRCLEDRVVRQSNLYSEYTSNIKFSENNKNKILIKDLVDKYSLTLSSILFSLYQEGIKNISPHNSNIFNLPVDNVIISSTHGKLSSFDMREAKKKLENYLYSKKYTHGKTDELTRTYVEGYKFIILQKNNDYDYAMIENKLDIKNRNTSDETVKVSLIEHKNSIKQMNYYIINSIAYISKNFGSYINHVGPIAIKNYFDESHIYDTTYYDEKYGTNAFHSALLNHLESIINLHGDLSIKYEKTVELIKKCVDNVTSQVFKNENKMTENILKDFIEKTTHYHDDSKIDIGILMDMYDINSYELLYVMYVYNKPFRMGALEYIHIDYFRQANNFSLLDAIKKLDENDYYIDYLYGKPIKTSFRKKKGSRQIINVKEYDTYTRKGQFYKCIFYLMVCKLKNINFEVNT